MSKIYAEDNPFNAVLTKIFDLCMLNIVTLVCCIPVVTAGASLTAMYAVMLPMSENKEGPVVKSFIKQFRANLKGSVKTWLLMLLAAVVLSFDLYVWTKVESQYRSVFFGFTIAMLVALAVVASWYFALRATFEDDGKTSLINAGKYSLVYLPVSVLMAAYTAAIVYVYLQQGYLALFIPIFGITLIEYPKAYYMRRKFNAYIEEHSDRYGVAEEAGIEENDETEKEEGTEKTVNTEAEIEGSAETEKETNADKRKEVGAETRKEVNAEGKKETYTEAEKEVDASVREEAGTEEKKDTSRDKEKAGREQLSKNMPASKEELPEENKNLAKGNSNKKKNRKKNKKKKKR